MWGRPVVFLNKAEYAYAVLNEKASEFERSALPLTFRATFRNGLLAVRSRNGEHLARRKMLQPLFRAPSITHCADVIVDCARKAQQSWKDGQSLNLRRELQRITLNVAGKVFLGVNLEEEPNDIEALVARGQELIEWEIRWPFHLPLWVPSRHNRQVRQLARNLHQFVERAIQIRRQNGSFGDDFLSLLLAVRDENGQPLDDSEVVDQATAMFLPAYEEIGMSLTWTCWLLTTHPHIYDRLLSEVDCVLGGRCPTLKDLERLPYTLQVLKEALRLYSPADVFVPRRAQKDIELDGYRIPRGMLVIVSPHLLHRKPEYFPDPESFQPDRFVPENEQKLPRGAYFPFGAGQHVCIGRYFALLEAHLVLTALSQWFRFEAIKGRDVQLRSRFNLVPKPEIEVVVRRREKPPAVKLPDCTANRVDVCPVIHQEN
jgi:cytochrome P450